MNYEKQAKTIHVIQLVEDVELGTQITESMLTTREIGLFGVDRDVVVNKADIVGKYAAMDIRHTTNLYADMFAETWMEVDGAIDEFLTDEDKLVTVSLGTGAASVGGMVRPGNIVDILTTGGETQKVDEFGYPVESSGTMELKPLMSGVMVYAVLNEALENIAELERQWVSLVKSGNDAAKSFDSSMTPAYVTLIVNDEQALILANQEYGGTIHLVLSPKVEAQLPGNIIPESNTNNDGNYYQEGTGDQNGEYYQDGSQLQPDNGANPYAPEGGYDPSIGEMIPEGGYAADGSQQPQGQW